SCLISRYWRMRGVTSSLFIHGFLGDLLSPWALRRSGRLFHGVAQAVQIGLRLLQRFRLAPQVDPPTNPGRKQQDGGHEEAQGEGAEDRFVNRRGGFLHPEVEQREVPERHLLLLILEEEEKREQQQDPYQDESDHERGSECRFGGRLEPLLDRRAGSRVAAPLQSSRPSVGSCRNRARSLR